MIVRLSSYLLTGVIALLLGAALFKYSLWPFEADGLIRTTARSSVSKSSNENKDDIYDQNTYWAKKIADGGYILHFRHANRDKWTNFHAFDALELIEQTQSRNESFYQATCLSNQGIEEAKMINRLFSTTGVSFSQVYSSPSCRAKETAEYAFGRVDAIEYSLLYPSVKQIFHDSNHKQTQQARKLELRGFLIGLKPEAGKNIALTGHGNTLKIHKSIFEYQSESNFGMEEGGFIIIEKVDDKLIVRHSFVNFGLYAISGLRVNATQQ